MCCSGVLQMRLCYSPRPSQEIKPLSEPGVPRLAFAALLTGNVALALGPWLVRMADTGPVAAGFWRLLLATPFLYAIVAFRKQRLMPGSRKLLITLLVGGVFFALDLGSWHMGIALTKLGNATLFGNSGSILFVIYGFIITRSLPSKVQYIAILLAVGGSILLMASSYQLSLDHLLGDLLCLLAGVLYAGYLIAMQSVRSHLGHWAMLAHSSFIGAVVLLVIAALMGEAIVPQNWTPLVLLALSSQLIGQGMIVYALLHFSPLVVGLALLTQPAMSALIGWLVFAETMTMMDATGMLAVALALVLVRLPARTKIPPAL
jgi:drug/metabolite transporter (DMT)-like permease